MLMLSRKPDWEDRLNKWLERCHDRSHRWGSHDCMMFPAGGCRAVTGFDPARGHRGKYRGAISATRYLLSLGWESTQAAWDDHLPRIPVATAQRGDLVFHDGHIGVCIGEAALFVGEEDAHAGLVRVPLRDCTIAWKVG